MFYALIAGYKPLEIARILKLQRKAVYNSIQRCKMKLYKVILRLRNEFYWSYCFIARLTFKPKYRYSILVLKCVRVNKCEKVPLNCDVCGNRNYHVPKKDGSASRLTLKNIVQDVTHIQYIKNRNNTFSAMKSGYSMLQHETTYRLVNE